MFLTFSRNYKEDGRLFYQQAGSSNYVEGKYVFKTSNNDYVTFDYIINPVFRDNAKIRIESEKKT